MSLPVYTVRKGDKGQVVRWVQERLGVTPDGVFGGQTEHEVVQWQMTHGLDADGICGPATLASMGIRVELGIDVHGGKGPVDWGLVAAAGVKHASLKCTEGLTFDDKRFIANCNGAKAAGLAVRAYHFARPSNPVVDEVHHALQAAGTVPLDLDLEGTGGLGLADLGKWACAFLHTVELAQKRVPHLYTNEDYWLHRMDAIARADITANFRLWVAAPGRATPPASFPHWDAHQFSWTSTIPGVLGDCDCDWVVSRD